MTTKKKKSAIKKSIMVPFEAIKKAWDDEIEEQEAAIVSSPVTEISKNYRKAALQRYVRDVGGTKLHACVMCGFGIAAVLEVAHLSQERSDNSLDNLAVLCPNCHKMHDIGLIPTQVIRMMRDYAPKIDWKLRVKDAGAKAANKKRSNAASAKRSAAAKRAASTRKKSAIISNL